jgi:hypothetical protein
MAIDGILRDPVTDQPEEHGRAMYHALANNYRITLLADETDPEAIAAWLHVEGFVRHTKLLPSSPIAKEEQLILRLAQIRYLRGVGAVDLVIDSSPALVDDLYSMGQPYLLYINPKTLAELPPLETWQRLAERIDETRARAAQALQHEDP